MMLRRFILCLAALVLLPFSALGEGEDTPDIPPIIHFLEAEDPRPHLPSETLFEIHFINIGAADAIFLRQGEQTMLLDSGTPGKGEGVLAYLAGIGIESLDYAFISHPHDDHAGGFLAILPKIPIGLFYQAEAFIGHKDSTTQRVQSLLTEMEQPVDYLQSEDTLAFGGASFVFYQADDEGFGTNDRSMILKATYGERTALFAGDIENRGQNRLAEIYGEALLTDILKMPHHGIAHYMAAFYEVTQPALSTFSNLRANIEDVARHTERKGIHTLFTVKGTIIAVTDGETWTVWQLPRE